MIRITFMYGCWIAEDMFGNQVWSLTRNQLMKAIGVVR